MQQELKEESPKVRKEPIGGWLLVMVILIISDVIFSLYGTAVFINGNYSQVTQFYYPGAYLYDIFYTGLSLLALHSIHKRRHSAISFMKMYYVIPIIEGLLRGSLYSTVHIEILPILWLIYLWKSERVKRTFTL